MGNTDTNTEDTDSDLLSSLTGTTSTTSSDALSSLSGAFSANTIMHMPPPPPPPMDPDMISELADKAVAVGALTEEEAAELKTLAEEQQERTGATALDPKIFDILKQYMVSTSETEETEELSMQGVESARLAALKEALAAAQSANALTEEQVAEVESFISNREEFMTLMAKIEDAGLLTPPEATASTTTDDITETTSA